MKRRYRRPPMRDGRISFWWGNDPHGGPDLCFQWGNGASKRDANFIVNVLAFNKDEEGRTFRKELERRGYDITTLRFTIDKKKDPA